MNLAPAEWVAIAAVAVAFLGTIANIVTTHMNNKAKRGEQLYEERIEHITRVYAVLLECAGAATRARIAMMDDDMEALRRCAPELRELFLKFMGTYRSSAIFLPVRTEKMMSDYGGKFMGFMAHAGQTVAEAYGEEPSLRPLESYEVVKLGLFRLEKEIHQELRRLVQQ